MCVLVTGSGLGGGLVKRSSHPGHEELDEGPRKGPAIATPLMASTWAQARGGPV